ncbi:MAG: hypothetical protein OEV87_11290 [Phycisphaerae bacterium]|nr:hypothetical protein [Phycisphaerae bacterium]
MLSFSSDVDLAKFEPNVFGSWYLSSQVLCSGSNGIVAGTQFTASGVDFTAAQVAAGHVIYLESTDGVIKGAFEVVDVIDSTHLTVSVLRTSSEQAAIPIGSASGLTWRIVTYAPQAYEILFQLSQKLGLSPGCLDAEHSVDDITNPDALRQASIFGILAMVFESLYTGADGQTVLVEKKEQYQWQFGKAVERLTVNIDTNADGEADKLTRPAAVKLVRE